MAVLLLEEHLNLNQPLGQFSKNRNVGKKRGLDWRRSVHILELGREGRDDGEGVTTGRLANLEDIF